MLLLIVTCVQFLFSIIIGLYFFNMLKSQQSSKSSIDKDSKKELEKLERLKEIKLTVPLSERTRPCEFSEIIGQEQGLKALKAALCGPNPQHVLIYGPPGIGKTAAARVVLEEAKKMPLSPFKSNAKFIETDATTMHFDERSIADPLIGSVHDPIYQGAGAYGPAGVPQPKAGAVTKAHGGVLFIDEIGELQPIQMNRLLKVLEDRKVTFESAYYSSGNKNIPQHIHSIFKNGLPADFRLVGATTRTPEEISPAIRSRCVEVFFRPLKSNEIEIISSNAAKKGGFDMDVSSAALVAKYAQNGRDAVNIVQTAGSVALINNRNNISPLDLEWVIKTGQYTPRIEKKISAGSSIGVVCGLAVYSGGVGSVLDIEVEAEPCAIGVGTLTVTGIVEQEEIETRGQKLKCQSSIRSSVQNVLTVMNRRLGIDTKNYNLHINFPNQVPVDGPSAGIAIVTAVYSAITGAAVDKQTALTGEISIKGRVCAVGGVPAKIDAAIEAGANTVIIPKDNWQENFKNLNITIITVSDINEVIDSLFNVKYEINPASYKINNQNIGPITAQGIN